MDKLYRLIDVENAKVLWEWNMEDSNIKEIKWEENDVYLYFLSGNVNKLKYNLITGERLLLNSKEWEKAKRNWE